MPRRILSPAGRTKSSDCRVRSPPRARLRAAMSSLLLARDLQRVVVRRALPPPLPHSHESGSGVAVWGAPRGRDQSEPAVSSIPAPPALPDRGDSRLLGRVGGDDRLVA